MAINVPLSEGQITRVLDAIAMKESTSTPGGTVNTIIGRGMKTSAIKAGCQNYGVINDLHYMGKYQIGYMGLADAGWCKTGIRGGNKALYDAATWTGKDGITDYEKFLTNPTAQEKAVRELFAKNYNYMRKQLASCSAGDIAGYCSAAHLVGFGGALKLLRGTDVCDANGCGASYYYKIGRSACLGEMPDIVKAPTGKNSAGAPPAPKKPEDQKGSDVGSPSVTAVPSVAPSPNVTPRVIEPERDDAVKVPLEVAQKYENTGFIDPNLVYPKSSYKKFPDTNKLATSNDINNTVVTKKNAFRHTGIPTATGNNWDEPESPYAAKYPYNKVTETESGHVIEIDDTPNGERLHTYHTSGTYEETNNVGSHVRRIVGDSYEIIDRNGNIFINGRCNITVGGACNVLVLSDANITVKGDTNITSKNDVNWNVSGNFNLQVNETFNIRSKNLNIETDEKRSTYVGQTSTEQVHGHATQAYDAGLDTRVKGIHNHEVSINQNISIGNDQATKVVGKQTSTVTGDIITKGAAKVTLDAAGDIITKGGAKVTLDAAGDIITKGASNQVKASGKIDMKAGGNLNIDATQTHINSGSANPGDPLAPLDPIAVDVLDIPVTTHTNLPFAADRTAYIDSSIGNLDYPKRNDSVDMHISEEKMEKTMPSVSITPESPKAAANVTSDVTPVSDDMEINPESFLTMTAFPATLQLSKFFTLGMLLRGNALTAQCNMTQGQIVYNLSVLAQTVLDKIRYNYGGCVLTSAYRIGSGGSQHNRGQAADIRIPKKAISEYEAVAKWISENCKYNQIILEGSQTSKNIWIHVSVATKFYKSQNQGIMTAYNDGTPKSTTVISARGKFELASLPFAKDIKFNTVLA